MAGTLAQPEIVVIYWIVLGGALLALLLIGVIVLLRQWAFRFPWYVLSRMTDAASKRKAGALRPQPEPEHECPPCAFEPHGNGNRRPP